MNEPIEATLTDVVGFLQAEGVHYALIGGLAASLRGQPRVTADVDLVIACDVPRALRLAASLEGSLFKPLVRDVAEVVEKSFILPLLHRVTNVKVDLVLGLSGFEHQAVARAEPLDVAGATVSVVTAEDLLLMKILAGRPQDDQDIHGLLMAQGERLDWDYCLTLGAQLGEALGQDLVTRIAALRSSI